LKKAVLIGKFYVDEIMALEHLARCLRIPCFVSVDDGQIEPAGQLQSERDQRKRDKGARQEFRAAFRDQPGHEFFHAISSRSRRKAGASPAADSCGARAT